MTHRTRSRAARCGAAVATVTLSVVLATLAPVAQAAPPIDPPVPPVPGVGELGPLPRPPDHPEVPVGPTEFFRGDFDPGDFSQWGTCQSVKVNSRCRDVRGGHYSMAVKPTPAARQGPFAARFEVRKGDVPDFGGSERSEVSTMAPGALTHEGDERWYEFSMYLPPDFPTPTGNFFIVLQWHAGSGSPPLAVMIDKNNQVVVGGDGVKSAPKKPIGPARRGTWVDYALHAGFSENKSKGFVEAWENGKLTVPRHDRQTMTSSENYLKHGIYRSRSSQTAVVWLDGLRVTGPAGKSSAPPQRPDLCVDSTPPGSPCTPPM